jgi:hypothetical protein
MNYDEFPVWVKALPLVAFVLGTRWGWNWVDGLLQRHDERRAKRMSQARDVTPR